MHSYISTPSLASDCLENVFMVAEDHSWTSLLEGYERHVQVRTQGEELSCLI